MKPDKTDGCDAFGFANATRFTFKGEEFVRARVYDELLAERDRLEQRLQALNTPAPTTFLMAEVERLRERLHKVAIAFAMERCGDGDYEAWATAYLKKQEAGDE